MKPHVVTPRLGALLVGGVLLACMVTVMGSSLHALKDHDPRITAPECIPSGTDLLGTAWSTEPPVSVSATLKGKHLPGSPDHGVGQIHGGNTFSFDTKGIKSGSTVILEVVNAQGASSTLAVCIQ